GVVALRLGTWSHAAARGRSILGLSDEVSKSCERRTHGRFLESSNFAMLSVLDLQRPFPISADQVLSHHGRHIGRLATALSRANVRGISASAKVVSHARSRSEWRERGNATVAAVPRTD